jgi:hypothetical protein
MSSSISSSDRPPRATRVAWSWRRWLIVLVALAFGGAAVLHLAVVLLDPYATGRVTPFAHFNVTTNVRMFAHAGRVRNPAFDAVITGNSRGFGLESGRLSQATGRRFVHLTLDAAFPVDQLHMVQLFATRRAGTAPMVLQVVDAENWCDPLRGRTNYDMPWWLYQGSNLTYLQRILTLDSLGAALRRARIALGLAGDFGRADGYELWLPRDTPEFRGKMIATPPPAGGISADAPFSNLDDLAAALTRLEPKSPVILFMPPVYSGALPVAGSAADARLKACKARLQQIAAQRPNTSFVDARFDWPQTRDPDNFIDATHYLDGVAMPAEADLVAAIKRLDGK